MSESTVAARHKSTVLPLLIGALAGIAFYFIVALGVFRTLWGPGGALIPSDAPEAVVKSGYWIGRVMSSWVNLFSFVAFGIAVALLVARAGRIRHQARAFDLQLLGPDEDALILPDDALEIRKRLKHVDARHQDSLLVQLLGAAVQRARANWSAEDCGQAVKTQAELVQGEIEAGYSMVRYLAWAIPAIGFIGTVLGIGRAMGALQSTKGQDMMSAAAGYLSMAFDTTFVALVLSLLVMYMLHRVEAADDQFLVRATDWCMRRFVFRMHIPQQKSS